MTLGIDFDGVIHAYSRGWQDGSIYDPPMLGTIDGLRTLMEQDSVFVFTARDRHQVAGWLAAQGINAVADDDPARVFWGDRGALLVTDRKLPATAYLDDRAVRFTTWGQALADLRVSELPTSHGTLPVNGCKHCPDGHTPSDGGSQSWSVWVGPERDGDGQSTTLHVARSAGAHVAESDAEWIRQRLNPVNEADHCPPAAPLTPEREQQLRQQIAAALYERESPPREPEWASVYPADREVFEAMADVVLPVMRAAMAAERARALTETEQRMLEYALDLADDEVARDGSDFSDDEEDALAELRRIATKPISACEQSDGVIVRPEEYTVTAVPDDASPDAHVWALTVRHRGGDRWAVQHSGFCLGADGSWARDVKQEFDLETALRLARQEAPNVTVNGRTVADVLARRQSTGGAS